MRGENSAVFKDGGWESKTEVSGHLRRRLDVILKCCFYTTTRRYFL